MHSGDEMRQVANSIEIVRHSRDAAVLRLYWQDAV